MLDALTPEEEEFLEERRRRIRQQQEVALNRLPDDPNQRSTRDNRRIFGFYRQQRFIQPMVWPQCLAPAEADAIVQQCKDLAWDTSRHSAFATTDVPLLREACPPLLQHVAPRIRTVVLPRLASHFGFRLEDLAFRDLFIVKYTAEGQSGLKLHTDGCLFSFNILLNCPTQFDGGGTFFESTQQVVQPDQGDCVYHDARIQHRGVDITRGERYILVGFVDTADTIQKDSLLPVRI
ncbi:hypothetical protein BCR43DRAFT_496039 [Syncephalastrum racemosum]|uniref:Prolyl 4-hydroxylase alpha subunit domain-containing protein n=1 Tax=Syncephalastrum racemosum TaxID=13706 RepID=A0A1X2H6Y1_SYNRA|nr:hypothetical protein BCR43DRAFT_496039 [Syncephalastrum racemosum]